MERPININKERFYDVIIVGGGPAGLTAALYLARARYRVLVMEKDHFGGQITITSEIVNYPGVHKTSGKELTETIRKQAQDFGAEFVLTEAERLSMEDDIKVVHTNRGDYQCFGVLLATGAHPRTVGFQGEEENKGRGVAYCATCDGEFFTGKDVFVVGGGFAAAEESVFLTKFARQVTILVREEDFTCAKSVAEQARNHEKITVFTNTIVEEVSGEGGLNYIRYKNTATGEVTEYHGKENENFGVFVFAGYVPATSLVKGIAQLNEQGYIITDNSQKTSVDGLYAAGDVCIKPLRQVVTAVGDGALAATELEKYAASMQEKTGMKPDLPVSQNADSLKTGSNSTASISGVSNATDSISAGSISGASNSESSSNELFTAEMKAQLDTVFSRMEQPLLLRLYLDERSVSFELEGYMQTLASMTEKLSVEIMDRENKNSDAPCVRICLSDGSETGLAFHGVPGGHEFTSFVLGLYNAAGSGQALDSQIEADIHSITDSVDMKVLVSLSCTMCPELVTAAQKIASKNSNVVAEVYDLNHFEELKERYNVMSVPCLIINDTKVSFGKKNIRQILDLIG
ncbi:MAG: FAD-dependent oxidoreductase [Lachnospiraceae bacterium]|nr:FAD-dependent oxidoreductase [Lachnospiraceae bacterium]